MQAKLSLNKSISDKLKILFLTVHAINIKARPLWDYEYIAALDEVKGLDVGNRYKTVDACRSFSKAIADVEQVKIKREI